MKILLISSSYNGLTQRVHQELLERDHIISIELASNDQNLINWVNIFKPDLIICPFLKQRIPKAIWREYTCIIVHPGIKGDRGPSSLDWAIQNRVTEWGVTALQAAEDMDAGDIWATASFKMRQATKSSIYSLEVTEAAVEVVLKTVENFLNPNFKPEPLNYHNSDVKGQLNPLMQQKDRRIDWLNETTGQIITKIRAADGFPGVLDDLLGESYYLYGATREGNLRGKPGELIATRLGAVCRATVDGAIWLSHLKFKPKNGEKAHFKLPATTVLGEKIRGLPELPISLYGSHGCTYREIWYEEHNEVGYLHFDFHNGAMSTAQCQRLTNAYQEVVKRPTKVLVLSGGRNTWSNGIHLNVIEAAADPAEESWQNINAIDDMVLAILSTTNKLTVAAVHGNAGAGGVMLALACDKVFARSGIIFNPHYKSMGLFGSEYWTYTLPKRIGYEQALKITENCMAMGAKEAKRLGMVDFVLPEMFDAFDNKIKIMAEVIAQDKHLDAILAGKTASRKHDEYIKPLKYYRQEELSLMWKNFHHSDSCYHPARQQFVYKQSAMETPERLRWCNPKKLGAQTAGVGL